MKHKVLLIYSWFIRTLFYFFPDIPIFMKIRGFFYGLGMIKCGKNFQVTHDSIIKGLEKIKVGNNVFVGNHSIIFGSGITTIGDEVMLGPHVVLVSGNHTFKGQSYRWGKADVGQIIIEKGCWIGANCTIVSGSRLPKYSILGANSFICDFFDFEKSLYAGSPARLIKTFEFQIK